MRRRCLDLPQDVWIHIFKKLDLEKEFGQVSLVSKQFLSITNPFKTSLNIFDETKPIIRRILRRFQHLESITISSRYQNIENLLSIISHTALDPGGRNFLKRLIFRSGYINDNVFTTIANLFPWIHEINCGGEDCMVYMELPGFEQMLPKLTELKSLSFGWNNGFTSDEYLISLSLNCVNLEEIDLDTSRISVNEETIGFLLRHSPKLTTLKLPKSIQCGEGNMTIRESIPYAKNLHSFCCHANIFGEELARALAKADLKKLEIDFFDTAGKKPKSTYLLELLQECYSMVELNIHSNKVLGESSFSRVLPRLTKLTRLDLNGCHSLTNGIFFTLLKKCPFLEEIKMDRTSMGMGEVLPEDLLEHKRVRCLSLKGNINLDDKTLGYILWVCPNLNFINVSSFYSKLTEEGIRGILKTCVLLNHLSIYELKNVCDIFGKSFEDRIINLKILDAGRTKLNDKALGEIGRICHSLELLSISDCEQVTNNGVMEVVRNCQQLKKLNLYGCKNLSIDILDDIVRSRPSIKRIVPPTKFLTTSKEQKEFFSSNGCKVSPWKDDDFSWCSQW